MPAAGAAVAATHNQEGHVIMAVLRTPAGELEVAAGSPLLEAAEELDIPFGCYAGSCGTCKVEVLAGAENLGPLTDEEQDMDLEEDQRLMCQASITGGVVEVEPA